MKKIRWMVFLLSVMPAIYGHAQERNNDEAEFKALSKLSFGGSISGRVVANFIDGKSKRTQQMGIPKTTVFLKSVLSGKVIKKAQVDSLGHFRFSRLDAGKYQICWERKGFDEGCVDAINVKNKAVYMPAMSMHKEVLDIQSGDVRRLDPDIVERVRDLLRGRITACQDGAGNDRFLFRKRNDINDNQARAEAIGEAYYKKIDPSDKKLTLGEWWELNGFDKLTGRAPAENNGYNAGAIAYLNDNDLGFGRNMHCVKKSDNTISCWVANHGAGDQDPANADLAAGYINPGPTVTMEYSPFGRFVLKRVPDFSRIRTLNDVELKPSSRPVISKQVKQLQQFNRDTLKQSGVIQALLGEPTVKFYVYVPDEGVAGQAHADFVRTTAANLDGCETRHVPGLCLNCHGGDVPSEIVNGTRDNWTETDVREVGAASFREFDTETFKYPGGRTSTNNVEDATFKRLNKLVQQTNPSAAIDELIDNWYSSSSDTSIDENYSPASWGGNNAPAGTPDHSDAYVEVVGKACRTCHVALGENLNWDDKSKLDAFSTSLPYYLCDASSDMPHAKITMGNLANSQRNTLLDVYGLPSCP